MLGQENVEKIKDKCGSLIAIKINDFTILENSEFVTNDDGFLQVAAKIAQIHEKADELRTRYLHISIPQ